MRKKSSKPSIESRWKEYLGISKKLIHNNSTIWFHAVSVGEVIASTPVLTLIREKYPNTALIITTTTTTGAQEVKKIISNHLNNDPMVSHRYMPLDIPYAINQFIDNFNPKKLIIMEMELWPNTLRLAKKNNIETIIINARLSQKSFEKYRKYTFISHLIYPYIDKICVQNTHDGERFVNLGVNKNNIFTTGSIKYDFKIQETQIKKGMVLKHELGINRPIWIAISTHEGEEKILIEAHKKLIKRTPNALLIIVPRHPERFNFVSKLIAKSGLYFVSRTEHLTHSKENVKFDNINVYLSDTMGEMFTLIAASDICFVAGSLSGDKIGGHNVLEPAALSKPILTGPSYYNFKVITEELIEQKGVILCKSSSDIMKNLYSIFSNQNLSKSMGKSNLETYNKNKGSVQRTLEII